MLALAATLVAAASASSSGSRSRVPVYFLQGEQLLRVTRPGATPLDALHQLVAGPTRAEAKRGVRTYIPVGTQVHSVSVAGGVATVDLGRRFASGRDAPSLLARLSQLVGTLTGLQGSTKVKLLIDGRTVLGVFPGVPTQLPITFRYLQTPNVPVSRGRAGKRAEILLDRQVALLIKDNKVLRTIAVSSGKPSTPTPPGDYRVYAKIRRWWSTPFREWLPYALPFVGGIAFHEFLEVPTYPASHGCVRQAVSVAPWTYAFAEVGMPVKVIARS